MRIRKSSTNEEDFEDTQTQGRPVLGFGPDLMTYNNIIWSVGNAGQLDLAKRIFHKLKATHSTQQAEDERSLRSKKQTKRTGNAGTNKKEKWIPNLRPNVYTYGSLMHGCVKARNYRQALYYLDMMEEHNITPNQIVFTSCMEACAESGKYREARDVMERMIELGMKPDLTMVSSTCRRAGIHDIITD